MFKKNKVLTLLTLLFIFFNSLETKSYASALPLTYQGVDSSERSSCQKKTCPSFISKPCKIIFIAFLWLGLNYTIEILLKELPEDRLELSNAVRTIQITLNIVITSPLFIPLQSWLNQKVYSLGTKNFSKKPISSEIKENLEKVWWQRQELLSQNSQISIDRWTEMDNNCKNFFILLEGILRSNSEAKQAQDKTELIAQALAYRLHEHKEQFPDFPPEFETTILSYRWLKIVLREVDYKSTDFRGTLFLKIKEIDSSQDLSFYEQAHRSFLQ